MDPVGREEELIQLVAKLPNFREHWKKRHEAGLDGVTSGDCIEVVGLLLTDLDAIHLAAKFRAAFGMVRTVSGKMGHHCWVETTDGWALDFIQGQKCIKPVNEFYAIGNVQPHKRLTVDQFVRMLSKLREQHGWPLPGREVFRYVGLKV